MVRGTPRTVELTPVTEWEDGAVRAVDDYLAAEEPLEIRVQGRPLTVTMRTPGNDCELAAGFLWTEGIIDRPEQIASLREQEPGEGASGNVVLVELKQRLLQPADLQRNFFAASSCGICGKASIEAIRVRGLRAPNPALRLDAGVFCELPARLRERQSTFDRTGGLHAAALFDASGALLAVREDIGRHNAVDKLVGPRGLAGKALHGFPNTVVVKPPERRDAESRAIALDG